MPKALLWIFKQVGWRRIGLLVIGVYAAWLVLVYKYHFIDNVNLLIHEAGHVLFGFMGEQMGFLGGTILQLAFPAAFVIHFLRRSQRFEAAVCTLWLSESGMYTATYMADANEQALPLVGGHIHDWWWLFGRWGVLDSAEEIGLGVRVLASLGAVGAVWWAARIESEQSAEA